MSQTVFRRILKRFAVGLGYQIWSRWLSLIVFTLLVALVMYLVSSYECPIRRALGYPLSLSENVVTGFYEHPWEQDCLANNVKP
jgi:hypothetical protein